MSSFSFHSGKYKLYTVYKSLVVQSTNCTTISDITVQLTKLAKSAFPPFILSPFTLYPFALHPSYLILTQEVSRMFWKFHCLKKFQECSGSFHMDFSYISPEGEKKKEKRRRGRKATLCQRPSEWRGRWKKRKLHIAGHRMFMFL